MIKVIKYYALEIYTVISMLILVIAGFMGDLSVIQKFVLVYIFLFILHEWEEMKYPGGFADLIAKMLGVDINDEMKVAAAEAIASLVSDEELSPEYIIPNAFDERVGKTVSEAVKKAAIKTGVNRI